MKKILFIYILFCFQFLGCNETKEKNEATGNFSKSENAVSSSIKDVEILSDESLVKIKLPNLDQPDAFLVSDVIDSVWYVPLETKEESLIRYIEKAVFYNDNIYILDMFGRSLLIFDSKGKFERKVGSLGRGPGEYLGPISFIIDSMNNEIILHDSRGRKIVHYNLKGEFLHEEDSKYRFSQFEMFEDGTFVVSADKSHNNHLTEIENYKLIFADSEWKINRRAFFYDAKAESELSSLRRCLTKHRQGFIYNPNFSYSIYSLKKNAIKEKYYIDAGNYTLPDGFGNRLTIDEFAQKYDSKDSKYAYIGEPVYETDHHLVTTLYYQKKIVFFYFSKISGKLICSSSYINDSQKSFVGLIKPEGLKDKDEFFGIVNSSSIVESKKRYALGELESLPNDVYNLINSVKENDNPVIAFYTIKDF